MRFFLHHAPMLFMSSFVHYLVTCQDFAPLKYCDDCCLPPLLLAASALPQMYTLYPMQLCFLGESASPVPAAGMLYWPRSHSSPACISCAVTSMGLFPVNQSVHLWPYSSPLPSSPHRCSLVSLLALLQLSSRPTPNLFLTKLSKSLPLLLPLRLAEYLGLQLCA